MTKKILAPLDIEIVSQQELGIDVDVEETGDTFVKNALIKQERLLWFAIILSFADDSGICVEALGGAPGCQKYKIWPVTMQRTRTESTNF